MSAALFALGAFVIGFAAARVLPHTAEFDAVGVLLGLVVTFIAVEVQRFVEIYREDPPKEERP